MRSLACRGRVTLLACLLLCCCVSVLFPHDVKPGIFSSVRQLIRLPHANKPGSCQLTRCPLHVAGDSLHAL
ncbi:hypothetical protein COO60DRAFT_239491 [Scenedesmus sp. NREL 46B-D3]|nr:hypothetical protein COO60DRAFT_239491 [Scenedesmus sp. NREL 46B-D3]